MAEKMTANFWIEVGVREGQPVVQIQTDIPSALLLAGGFDVLGTRLREAGDAQYGNLFDQLRDATMKRREQVMDAARAMEELVDGD